MHREFIHSSSVFPPFLSFAASWIVTCDRTSCYSMAASSSLRTGDRKMFLTFPADVRETLQTNLYSWQCHSHALIWITPLSFCWFSFSLLCLFHACSLTLLFLSPAVPVPLYASLISIRPFLTSLPLQTPLLLYCTRPLYPALVFQILFLPLSSLSSHFPSLQAKTFKLPFYTMMWQN